MDAARPVHTVTHGELTLQLLRKVGGGAFGSVWEATLVSAPPDGPPPGHYALKRVNFARYAGQSVKERVANREFTLPPRVDYPFLCRHYASWRDGDIGWLLMEFVPGCTLLQVIQHQGQLGEDRLRWIAKQLLNAVAVLHLELDLLHRDIKPSNIMVTNEHDFIKLVDYGFVAPNDMATTTLGTPAYMAPEIRSGKYGSKADIFAIGMTLLHAAVCYVPQASAPEAMTDLVRDALSGHSPAFRDFILRLVEPREHLRTIVSLALSHPFLEPETRPVPWLLRGQEEANDVVLPLSEVPPTFRDAAVAPWRPHIAPSVQVESEGWVWIEPL